MEKRVLRVLVVFQLLGVVSVCVAGAWGPIKHMTILEEVIRHPDLNPEIRGILKENLKYAKGGAVGPDLGNFDFLWNSANASHYCSPLDLARSKLELRCEEASVRFLPISALS